MSAAGAFAFNPSIVKNSLGAAGLSLSLLFSGAAQAGTFYDQCLAFVIDSSQSTKPKGWEGQVKGIAAGIRDGEVVSKISKMQTGLKVFVIGFSSAGQVKLMHETVLNNQAGALQFADFMDRVAAPFDGGNDLHGGMMEAWKQLSALKTKGESCERTAIDFSGDGADTGRPHGELQQLVRLLAKDGITIHGFSFVDVKWGKFMRPEDTNWHSGDRGKFQNIHDYYEKVVVTPVGLGIAPGRHYKVFNNQDINTVGSVETQFINIMRDKVRFEIAGLESAPGVKWAMPADGLRMPYQLSYNLK